jgi:pimeloyl-ACP methyl ester carboxylesterase
MITTFARSFASNILTAPPVRELPAPAVRTSAPTCLLVPGIFAGGGIWRSTLQHLDPSTRCVVVRDAFAGMVPSPETLADCVASIEAELAAIPRAWGRVVLIGNSLGALIAVEVATRRPERVGGLVLSGAPGLDRGFNVPRFRRGAGRHEEAYIREFLAWLFYDPDNAPRDLMEETKQLFEEHQRTIVSLLRQTRDRDIPGLLTGVPCPVLCLWGSDDRVTPGTGWQALARTTPGLRFITIPESGHSPMIERPDVFASHVEDYIASLGL